ncbi:hypothetical protein CGCF413_v012397 [Colletotrichum fructicola]|nr:hypothetical protein CGCF413_v012397 [Colletotrichum fructicola]
MFMSAIEPHETAVACCPSGFTAKALGLGCFSYIPRELYTATTGCHWILDNDIYTLIDNTYTYHGRTYTENEINQALADMANGISARNASRRWGVPRSTLQDRTKGAQQRAAAFEDLQRLSHTQEAKLASWVQIQADLGLPPTHQQVKDFAQRILHAMGDTQPLGKRWMDGFLRRNPSIKAMVQISRDASHHSHQTS